MMRIRFAAFILVLLLGLGTFACASASLHTAEDQVEFTATHIEGNVSAAEGLQITLKSTYDNHLHWETVFRPAPEPEVASTFRYTASRLYTPWQRQYRVGLQTSFPLGYAAESQGSESAGFQSAYEELIAEAPAGQETSRTFRIADYFDNYPLSVILEFPEDQQIYFEETGNHRADSGSQSAADIQGSEAYITNRFNEFFRIPVNPEETMHLHVTKDKEGNLLSTGGGSSSSQNYYMSTSTVFTSEEAYFSFNTFSEENPKVVDTSLIPGGYGIYRLPYTAETSEYTEKINDYTTRIHQIYGIDADSLSMVYSMDPNVYFLDLSLSSDQSQLLLHTKEQIGGAAKYVVTVIDESTMETLQRLETDWPENDTGGFYVYDGDGFFAAVLNRQYLYLFTQKPSGEYVFQYDGTLYSETAGEILFWVYDTDFLKMAYDPDTQRLALTMMMDENPTRTAFYLAVFTPEGLSYYGTYYSSLGAEPPGLTEFMPEDLAALDLYSQYGEYDSHYLCTPADADALSLCWN